MEENLTSEGCRHIVMYRTMALLSPQAQFELQQDGEIIHMEDGLFYLVLND